LRSASSFEPWARAAQRDAVPIQQREGDPVMSGSTNVGEAFNLIASQHTGPLKALMPASCASLRQRSAQSLLARQMAAIKRRFSSQLQLLG